jgi:crotonobetainyl-CoA:carnitine CoA-transferase CaiB-like acyl-CoA transferase
VKHLRVVDLSTWIAGAYCTKLLADAGAEVTKVESQRGDPLRRWSASDAEIAPGESGALFNFLDASKRFAAVDDLDGLLASADVVVWSRDAPVSRTPGEILAAQPHLTVTAITPFGLSGPWADRAATEFTLQAWSGGIIGLARGAPELPPVSVGGQIGEWLSGAFAAIGTVASRRRAACSGEGEVVDVSMLEALAMCLTYYPVTYHDQLGRPMRRRRYVPTPGVGTAKDGLVGLGVGTGQQWLDFAALVGHPEWGENPKYFLDRTELAPAIDAWIPDRTVDEVLELASAFRIPNAPIADGANVATLDHFVERGTFVKNPIDGALNPDIPYRITTTPTPNSARKVADTATKRAENDPSLPFSGLRVLDMTAYWAGPFAGHVLAMLGAEVIHLESPSRPDGVRLVGGVPQTEDRYWERGPIFSALNTNKKSLTVDLADPRGVELLRRFVSTCDVVLENYTPRVLDQLGLSHESLREARPDLVMVRMPGFGLDGPWRERAAFAFVIEDASGLTALTGYPDQLPIEPYCVGDPNAGLHALFGMLVALARRDETGEGALVEAAMVDAAVNVAAEQVIEHSAYGALLTRSGNRGPRAAPQGLYEAAGDGPRTRDERWVAIAVADDAQWSALVGALGSPAWASDASLATSDGRVRAHDRIDELLGEWCRARSADEIVACLWDAGVPVARVMQPHDQPSLAQLEARAFFESVDHPVAGPARYSTLPMRFSRGPEHLHRRHAPLLGEHTAELLAEIGLTPSELDALEADGIIGCALAART